MFDLLPKIAIEQTQIDAIIHKVRDLIASIQKSLPNTLWHYTDSAGLKGIVTSNKLRATHVSYLNDSSEYLHAVNLLFQRIQLEKLKRRSKEEALILEELEGFVGPTRPEHTGPYFVTCFSTAEDSLNQWRAYGRGEGGYSIGFDAHRLRASSVRNGFLSSVIYDQHVQTELVEKLLTWGLDYFFSLAKKKPSLLEEAERTRWWNWFMVCAAGAAPMMKNPAFNEEAEWRFIHLCVPGDAIEFGSRPTGLYPYIDIEYPLGTPLSNKLPITELWSGPGRATAISLLAGRGLMEKYNHVPVTLKASQIPFRVG